MTTDHPQRVAANSRGSALPEQSEYFRRVQFEEVGRVEGPHYLHGGSYVAWVGPAVAGIFSIAPHTRRDLAEVTGLADAIFAIGTPRALYSDVRAFKADGEVYEDMLRWVLPGGPMRSRGLPARTAAVVPPGWSRAWWVGTIALGGWNHAPIQAFADPFEAWAWLGAGDDAILNAVIELQAIHTVRQPVCSEVEQQVRADPALGIERAARLLGRSTRSLQRALSAAGETFGELRNRARAEVAAERLSKTDDKIEVIASEAGFRSRSHFATWFRGVTGQSPSEYRERTRSGR